MRLIGLAIGSITFLYLGLQSLDMQLSRTDSQITKTGDTGTAFNLTESVLGDITTTLGVSTPGFFLAAIVAFVAVLYLVALTNP